MSAPMGGFGVSKYLSRSEPSNAFPPTKRHQLPLPSPSSLHQSSASSNSFGLARSDSNSALSDAYSSRMPAPRSLQRDLSSSSLGASFESRSPPASSSMKRPLADMADSQDRNRDIDSRHQSHHDLPAPHQSPRVPFSTTASISSPSTMSTTSTSSLGQHSRPLPTGASKLDIKSMPPDHPTIDPASSGVCPIVHGSMQRERAQQQVQSEPKAGSYRNSMEHERHRGADQAPCRWANMSDRWNEPSGQGNFGQDYYGPSSGYRREHEREHEREPLARKSLEHGGESMQSNGAYYPPSNSGPHSRVHAYERDYAGSNGGYFGPQGESHRANGYSSHPRDHHHEADSGMAKNPFNMGPSPPGTTGSLRRTNSTGRPGFLSRNRSSNGSMNDGMCLSGACGAVCRCSGEDEEIRAVKALDAARKRMSVHSLLC
ncbi:hypothetical protein BGW38_004752 [Lunasporangiospora selenospora]|uniref:Uncharacterized protein n=1 Tax=Lunasporangiospora selenospora TaxID=979761 RepID=A0A9P6FQV3_9FUNG|nr:hypothetical protein BGW38_004752 [Lunasporangiospora selenospora]